MIVIEQIAFENIDLSDGGEIDILTNGVEVSAYFVDFGVQVPFKVTMEFEEYGNLTHKELIQKCEEVYNKSKQLGVNNG
jgi:hypothetical protein